MKRLWAEAALACGVGQRGALLCELVQYLDSLIAGHQVRGAELRDLLECAGDLLADGEIRGRLLGKLMQDGCDLLLLVGNLLLLRPELLAKTLLTEDILAEPATGLAGRAAVVEHATHVAAGL